MISFIKKNLKITIKNYVTGLFLFLVLMISLQKIEYQISIISEFIFLK